VKNPLAKFFGPGTEQNQGIKFVKIENISPNPYQPRTSFGEKEIKELAASIEENGLLQPLLLRPTEDGYQVIAGERRMKALKMLGKEEAPCLVKKIGDREMAQLALVENLQREDLNFFEEATGYQRMLFTFDLTQDELAEKVGRSQSAIANKLRLLRLPAALRDQIIEEGLTERHARTLLKLGSPEMQKKALQEVIRNNYSVGQTEKLVEKYIQKEKETSRGKEKGRVLKVFEDTRLYVNTIRKTVKEMKEWGLDIQFEEEEGEDAISFHIKLPKIKK